jgi:mannose-6-phosphate isomerase-like protein (cupin superfamily)
MIERVVAGSQVLAVIVRASFRKDGIEFFTPGDYSQQLAYMNRPAGYRIQAHVHNEVHRNVFLTQEVLFIRSGRVRIDFYDSERRPTGERVLEAGDVILLAAGGHGFTMLEPTEMIEVKQGPYAGDRDKTRFGS